MSDKYYIFLDESGDTGWTLSLPYQHGGSSRYLTIAMIVVHEQDRHRLSRVIKKLKEYYCKKYNKDHPKELKATDLKPDDRSKFLELFDNEASKRSKYMSVFSKTVKKENVKRRSFTENPNSLYNYMTGYLIEKLHDNDSVLTVDARVMSVNLKHSFDEYLHAKWAGDLNRDSSFSIIHANSQDNDSIQCIDIITNIIWRKHELNVAHEYERISKYISDGTLFF